MRRLVVAGVAAAALAAPVPATAAPDSEVGIEDERLLLTDARRAPAAVRTWAAMGVDVVRIHARWWTIAPGEERRRRPRRFDPRDHEDRLYDWRALDRAVRLVTRAGMRVMLTVTGPGPLWASRDPERGDPRYLPDPTAFAAFAGAVATRYGSQVDRYLIWNEPNQPGWLMPQSRCRARNKCTPVAPHTYRGLVRAAEPAIQAADPAAQLLIGELSPVGRGAVTSRTALQPLPFLRELACVDRAYRPLTTGSCRGFLPASGDGLGYHPHGVLTPPDRPNPDRNEAQLADLDRLVEALDRITRAGRLRARGDGLDLYLTEFGYQTDPPDELLGVSVRRQARYLQQAAYIAWRHPRVRNLTQYQWFDEPTSTSGAGVLSYEGWQSGLLFQDGRAKPARGLFSAPFVIDLSAGDGRARLWGQIRPGTSHVVTVERRGRGEERFAPIGEVETDAEGYWTRDMAVHPGAEYRYSWRPDPTERRARASGTIRIGTRPGRGLRASTAAP